MTAIELTKIATEIGLDAIAITHPKPFTDSLTTLKQLQSENLYPEFVEKDLQLRTNPQQLLPSVKSIISVAIAYKTLEPESPRGTGLLSRYAWGKDYHIILTDRLQKLVEWMQQNLGLKEYLIAVDTKPTIDRAIALRAGLGWLGQNCNVFIPNYGSWVFLGSILVDLELTPTESSLKKPPCSQECGHCIKACPTNALYAPYKINPHICISYLTQMKGFIPLELRPKIGVKLWGCDTCQQVCPENKKAKVSPNAQCFLPQEAPSIPIIPLLNITKKEFTNRFGKTALGWRGKGTLQRNAAIVAGNQKLIEAVDELKISLQDPKTVIRGTAAWALGEINTKKTRDILANARAREHDEQVLKEIELALN